MRPANIVLLTEGVIRWTIFLVLLITPLLFSQYSFELFEYPKMIFVYISAVIIGTAWIIRMLEARKIIYRRSFFDLPVALFLGSIVLSTLFSIDPHTSLFGFYSRFNGGLLSITAYILLFEATITFARQADLKRYIWASVASAVVVTLWGIPSRFGADPTCLIFQGRLTSSCWSANFNPTLRLFSTLGQPNWLASYLVLASSFVLSQALLCKAKRRGALFLLLLAMLTSLFWTDSRGGLLGLTASLIVFSLSLFLRSRFWLQRSLLGISTIIIVAITLFSLRNLIFARLDTIFIRKSVWQGGIEIWKHYPLLGSGVETFAYAFDHYRPLAHLATPEWDFIYNKAHNEFVNTLATTGLLGLGTYLLLIGTFLSWLWRLSKSEEQPAAFLAIGVLSGIAGYLVSIFFGFSVVATQVLFFLLPALSLKQATFSGQESLKEPLPTPSKNVSLLTRFAQLGTLAMGFFLLSRIVTMFSADLYFAKGRNAMNDGLYGSAFKYLTEAVMRFPDEPTYLDDFAFTTAVVARSYTDEDRGKLIALANSSITQALQISPTNVSLWKTSQQVYTQLAQIDPAFANLSTASAREAVRLAPNDIHAKQTLASLLLDSSSPSAQAQAYALLTDSVTRKPNFAEGWYSLALLEEKRGSTPAATYAMQKVLALLPNHETAADYLKRWATQSAK